MRPRALVQQGKQAQRLAELLRELPVCSTVRPVAQPDRLSSPVRAVTSAQATDKPSAQRT